MLLSTPSKRIKPSDLNIIFYTVITSLSLAVLAGYIVIAAKSFFFQDDFDFLEPFVFNQATLTEIGDVHLFRPLSKNLFFLISYRLFGLESFGFSLINIMAHSLSAICLFFLLVKLKLSHKLSALVALLFFSNVAAFEKLTWICCFQHTSYHLFLILSALFVILSVDTYGLKKLLLVLSSVISWICVLLSNMAGIFFPIILMLLLTIKLQQNNDKGRRQILPLLVKATSAHWFILLIWLVLILIPYWKQPNLTDPYYIDISIRTILNNLQFYLVYVFFSNAKGIYLIALSIIYALFLTPKEIKYVFLEKKVLFNFLTIILISGLTYAPFAFLKYQKYPYYISLTLIPWYIIILFPLFNKDILTNSVRIYKKIIIILLVCLLTLSFLPNKRLLIEYFKNSPKIHIHSLWNQTKSILPEIPEGIRKVVFVDNELFNSHAVVTAWQIPPFWWHVSHGAMFRILYHRQDIEFEVSTHKIITPKSNVIYVNVDKSSVYYSLSIIPQS